MSVVRSTAQPVVSMISGGGLAEREVLSLICGTEMAFFVFDLSSGYTQQHTAAPASPKYMLRV